jgi:hypothetical protein
MIAKEKNYYNIYLESIEDSLAKTELNLEKNSKLKEKNEIKVAKKAKNKTKEKSSNKLDSITEKKERKKSEQSKKEIVTLNTNLKEANTQIVTQKSLVKHSNYILKDTLGNNGNDSVLLSNCIANLVKDESAVSALQYSDTIPNLKEFVKKNEAVIFKGKSTYKVEKITFGKSIFVPHVLKARHTKPIFIEHKEKGVGFSIIFLALILFAIIQVLYHKRFQMFRNAFLNNRYAAQIMREENVLNYRISQLLTVVFLLTGSLFIFQINKFYGSMLKGISDWEQYGIIFSGFSSFFLLKYIMNKMLGYIFLVEKEVKEFLFNYFLFNQFWGLGSIIILALLEYGRNFPFSEIMVAGLASYALVFVYQIIRSYSLAMPNKRISNLYLFLYFCTLEILPLVIISSFLF